MRVTIRDVATRAGVSVATVSRVFNDSGPVHEETRRRIREAARELRYAPNSAARSLSTRRTSTLGVLLPDLHGEFFSEIIRGIDLTAQRRHHHLIVSSSHNHRSEVAAALRAMRGRVDGLILMSPAVDAETLVAELPVPDTLRVVLLNCAVRDPRFDGLEIDNIGGARAVVEHLTGCGHRRVAMILGPARNHDADERRRGYRAALRAAGLEPRPEWEHSGDFTDAAGYQAAAALLRLVPRPTAIVAANDAMAIGALSAVREAGLRVPEDMAVVGFDDVPIARYVHPPLTTVRVGIGELGARAAETLLEALAEGEAHRPRHVVVPTTLVVRDSCGCRDRSPPASLA
ncbi:MAG TPA: LacI family DNA-binding transcriptional regulator [Gemmatimonadaceae bacterium]|nr:LacI family DNA-binding transcriptional regulator [Gemmatimonadaceae bacterium]